MRYNVLSAVAFVLMSTFAAPNGANAQAPSHEDHCRVTGDAADLSQAFLMLDLLDTAAGGQQPWALVDSVLGSAGTTLVIGQLNLARRVSPAQYGLMLRALLQGARPEIAPVDSTSRAAAGVAGLDDAYERLLWASEHTAELRSHLEALRELDIARHACSKAFANLPHAVDVDLTASVVIGGRAGAAALSPASIYVDLAVLDLVAEREGLARASDSKILDFFAHETHHIGLRRILDARNATTVLAGPEAYAARVLDELVSEGSATYLIDFDGDLEAHLHDRGFAMEFADPHALLGRVERVISRIFTENIGTDAGFDEVAADLVGNRYHAAGAYMFSIIDRVRGRPALMRVIENPGILFSEYVTATSGEVGTAVPRLDDQLARRLATMGSDSP